MRRRQVKVVGNCQAAALAGFYRDFVGAPNLEDVQYVDDLGKDEAALRRACADADLIIVQERDFKHGLSKEELGGKADVFTFPMIVAGFLWPFANEPHVRNIAERPISDGPYPSQMSDSFLNRLIARGVSPEEALDQYLALDIGRAASLDRMLDIYLDRQRRRDEATGFEIAEAIVADFRTEKLFLTAEHPDARLFGIVASRLFKMMNVPADIIGSALRTLARSPFPPTELPLHPGVIAHFGLTFANADTCYTYMDEGRFTFAEYVLRYMRYENNRELRHAIYHFGRNDPATDLAALDQALERSPASQRGLLMRASALERLGRREDAEVSYRRAIEIDSTNPDGYVDLGRFLMETQRLAEAESMGRDALALVPLHGPAHLLLAEIQLRAGKIATALDFARDAVTLLPSRAHTYRCLGIALSIAHQLPEAERYARRGMLMEPTVPDHRNLVAEVVEGQDRRSEAVALLEESIALGYDNDQTYSLLGNFFMRDAAFAEAEAAFARGVELHGAGRPDLRECLAQVREMRAATS